MFNLLTANLSVIVDVVVIVLILLFGIIGFVRGFVKTFFKIFGTVLALLLASALASKVTLFAENKFGLVTTVGGWMEGVLNRIFGYEVMNTTLAQAGREYLSNNGVGNWLIEIIMESQADGSIPLNTTLNQIIVPSFAYYVAMVLMEIVLFILFKIIFFLVGEIFQGLHDIKLIGIPDKLLGLALGLLLGFVIVELVITIIGILPIEALKEIHVVATGEGVSGFIHRINIFGIILNSIATGDIVGVIKQTIAG